MLNEEDTFQRNSARSQNADPFLFAPESEMWRINRERCGLIYGPAAAILQVAHPRIAQGVHDHSNFRTDIMGRLHRTLKSTNRIAFGRVSEAEKMKTRLAAMHGNVRGAVSPGIKGPRAYSAFEPDLLIWVLATLINAAVSGFQFIYGSYPSPGKRLSIATSAASGHFSVSMNRFHPRDGLRFEAYYDGMVEGDLLGSHSMCRELARSVIYPQDSAGTRFLGWGMDFLPIETLPPKVRDRLGLRSTISSRFRMRLTQKCVAKSVPGLPPPSAILPGVFESLRAFALIVWR